MADQDDFTFDEQDSDSEEWYEEEPKKKSKGGGSRSRILLLLLLLVVIAGGGYYFMMMSPDDDGPAAPTKSVVKIKKQPIAMPSKPKAIEKAPAPVPVEKPATDEAKPEEKVVAAPIEKSEPMPSQEKEAAAPVKIAAKPDPVPTPRNETVFESPEKAPMAAVKTAPSVAGPYTLTAGTYLLESSVKSVSKKIKALGYEPVSTPVKRNVTMTRLKVGTYAKAEAAAKLVEIKRVAPDAFSIQSGNQETVYVGSYLVLDKARRYADTLYKKGISLIEEPVQVEKTLQRITFGSFASAEEAKSAGLQAAEKGIEAQVFKNR